MARGLKRRKEESGEEFEEINCMNRSLRAASRSGCSSRPGMYVYGPRRIVEEPKWNGKISQRAWLIKTNNQWDVEWRIQGEEGDRSQ